MSGRSDFLKAQFGDEGSPIIGQGQVAGGCVDAARRCSEADVGVDLVNDVENASFQCSVEKDKHELLPWQVGTLASLREHQHRIDLQWRELIMECPKVELVEKEALRVDLPSVSAAVTIRAEGDQIFIIVGSTLLPRDDVMNVNFDLATGMNCTTVPRLDKDAPL